MYFDQETLGQSDKIKRLNLINGVSGVKPANLIGTISDRGQTNLAIFSSVIHLGSNPPLLGFIARPDGKVRRHTIENIREIPYYTINHVNESMAERAHYTSAKFDEDQSEFDFCDFNAEYLKDFKAPFVAESQLKIGMKFLEMQHIKANDTMLIIGEIQHLVIPDDAVSEEGHIDLGLLKSTGLSGLNSYYRLDKFATFPYARVQDLPDFPK